MNRIEQKVISFINQNNLIDTGDKILIALSGGPDSVMALHFLNKYKRKYKIEITALHFNHKLRGKEADKDEEFCVELCGDLNVPFYSIELNVKSFAKQNKYSIEEAARILRYKYLQEISEEFKCTKIVTAHNQSDNTETILLNLFSGTGFSGLTGIPIQRSNIIRPLLCLTKEEIRDYLKKNSLAFRIDRSNITGKYKRNLLRNKIIPLIQIEINPSIDNALFRSTKTLEDFLTTINSLVDEIISKKIRISKGTIFIKSAIVNNYSDGILGEVFKKVLKETFFHEFDYNDLIKLKSLICKQKGKVIVLSKFLVAVREQSGIRIKYTGVEKEYNVIIKPGERVKYFERTIGVDLYEGDMKFFGKNRNTEYITGNNLDDIFILRTWKSGDKFIPLGMKEFKKISDFLTDLKIPSSDRRNFPVLLSGNNIVWVPGLRIDDRYKITSKTKKVYILWMK